MKQLMTQGTNDNGKLPPPREKARKGSCLPIYIPLPEEVADDLRRFIFDLVDTKQWANRSDREIAGDIINADERGTDLPRFYTCICPHCDGQVNGFIVDNEYYQCGCRPEKQLPLNACSRKRLSFKAIRSLLKTYRSRSLEVFKDDLVPYLQEAIVEVIKTAGKKPANLKIILDALGVGKETKDVKPEPDTPSPAYLKVPKGVGDGQKRLEANVPKRTGAVTAGLRAFGYEGLMRDDISKRRRLAARVVPRRDDTGNDGPPNIIEVDGGPYAFTALSSEDDILDYGREYLVDTEESKRSNADELSSPETDEEGDGQNQETLHGE